MILLWLFSLIGVVIVTIGCYGLVSFIQTKVFVPDDYIVWIFNYPGSRLVFIFEFYFLFLFFRYFNRKQDKFRIPLIDKINNYINANKKRFYTIFGVVNLVIIYAIIFSVTIITNDKVTNYSFTSPLGREYTYDNIEKIDTGIHSDKIYLPFTHTRGDFYYFLEFNDGTKIDLNDSVGGCKNDKSMYKVFEELDATLVNRGINKIAKADNFDLCAKRLDKIYSDRIKTILTNVK